MPDIYPLYPFYKSAADPVLTPERCAADLETLLSEALANWRHYDEGSAAKPIAQGRWSTKEVIGHLCDSAGNNLQRIVRLSTQDSVLFPRYDQEVWVREQRFNLRPLADLLTLFESVQEHLAHVIRFLNPTSLDHVWVDDGTARSLRHLLEDYLGHLQHHMDQVPLSPVNSNTAPFLPQP